MVLLVIAVVIGLIAGVARPPAGIHSVRPQVEQIPLLGLGALLNASAVLLDGSTATLCMAASLAVLIAVAMANRHITGVLVVGLGLLVNLAALAVNGGMPVRPDALVAAGIVEADELATTTTSGPRHLETDADALGVLGDVLPVPFAREVMSFGDLIVVLGAGDAVRELSRRRARREADAPAYAGVAAIATTRVDQLWGTAPSPRPVSATQYSENPDADTPERIDLDREAAAVRSFTELVASQSR